MGFNIKFTELFTVTILLIILFAISYWYMFNLTFTDALYRSASIQSMGGNNIDPKTDPEKIIVSTQTYIAFMILGGLITISV